MFRMRSTSTGSRKSINDRMPENIAPKSHLPNYLTIKNNSNKGNVLTDPYQIIFPYIYRRQKDRKFLFNSFIDAKVDFMRDSHDSFAVKLDLTDPARKEFNGFYG